MIQAGLLEAVYDELNWFALYTRPRTEKKLNQLLKRFSIESYLPLIKIKKKWSDRYKIVEFPLFTSYIFVKIIYRKDSIKVLQLPQAVGFVHYEGKPAILDADEMDLIRTTVDEFPDRLKVREEEMLNPGTEVKIKTGPFKGRTAIIEKVKNRVFVILKVKSIQKTLQIEIHKDDIGFEDEF
jgi:transcriptional antiterminator RfaH